MRTLAKNATKARNKAKPPGERQYQTNGRLQPKIITYGKACTQAISGISARVVSIAHSVAPAPCTTTGAAPLSFVRATTPLWRNNSARLPSASSPFGTRASAGSSIVQPTEFA